MQVPANPPDQPVCVFCSRSTLEVIEENATAFAIYDTSPVTDNHMLIIPKRHCWDYFSLTEQELLDCHRVILTLKEQALGIDTSISGFNIGVNCGQTAGQTIFHVHIHLIPRRQGDIPNPRGGVRGVIPDRMNY